MYRALEKRVIADPQPDELLREADNLLRGGNFVAAKARYRELLQSGVENASLLCNLAVICWQRDRLTEMESLLRRALALSPHHGYAPYNLAHSLAACGANR